MGNHEAFFYVLQSYEEDGYESGFMCMGYTLIYLCAREMNDYAENIANRVFYMGKWTLNIRKMSFLKKKVQFTKKKSPKYC